MLSNKNRLFFQSLFQKQVNYKIHFFGILTYASRVAKLKLVREVATPSLGIDVGGDETSSSKPPTEITIVPLPQTQREPVSYEYAFQQRIASEWDHLLGRNNTPANNLRFFMDRASQLYEISTVPNLVDQDTVLRKLAILKFAAIRVGTSYRKDVSAPTERKLMEVIPDKYNSDAFTEMRLLGYTIDEIRHHLKSLHQRGEAYRSQGVQIPEGEQEARKPRVPSFPDTYQDMSDTWQRATYGSHLSEHNSLNVVLDEASELIMEFDGMTDDEIDNLRDEEKLEQILCEISDVDISIDGVFASKDEDVESWQNFALDRMIDTYGDLPRLTRKYGIDFDVAMKYLRECRERDENGTTRPPSPHPNYPGPVFRVLHKRPLEPNFSSSMIH